jgi:Bestrophin, RFP-TM, chloride channel
MISIYARSIEQRVQKAIMKYVCTSLAMVFSFLSPMVRKRLFSSERNIKAKLELDSIKAIERVERKLLNMNSSHFMPIKWALHCIHEARLRNEVDERLANSLVVELNGLHTQCDRLINFKHETFSWGITKGVMTSLYTFFVVGAVSN